MRKWPLHVEGKRTVNCTYIDTDHSEEHLPESTEETLCIILCLNILKTCWMKTTTKVPLWVITTFHSFEMQVFMGLNVKINVFEFIW